MGGKGSGGHPKIPRALSDDVSSGRPSDEDDLLFFPQEEWDPRWREPRVRLLHYDETSTQYQFHGYLPLNEAGPALLTEMFGGGKWKLQVTAKDDTGKEAIVRGTVRTLPGPYKRPIKELPGLRTSEPETGSRTVAVRGDGALPTAGESLNAALVGSVIDLLKAQRESSRVAGMDWSPIITAVTALLTTILTKLMDRGPDPMLMAQLHAVEADLAALKEKPGPAASAITDALEGIERIVKVSAAVRRMAGSDESPTDPEAAMWGLGKVALETLIKSGQPGALPPPGVQDVAKLQAVGSQPPPSSATPLWQRILIHHGRDMLQAARRGVDPALAAEWTMKMLPSDVLGVVVEFLKRPDAASVIMQVVPDLASFPTWVDEFVSEARAEVIEGPEPSEEEASEEPADSAE